MSGGCEERLAFAVPLRCGPRRQMRRGFDQAQVLLRHSAWCATARLSCSWRVWWARGVCCWCGDLVSRVACGAIVPRLEHQQRGG